MLKFSAAVFECIDNGEKKRGGEGEREKGKERENCQFIFWCHWGIHLKM